MTESCENIEVNVPDEIELVLYNFEFSKYRVQTYKGTFFPICFKLTYFELSKTFNKSSSF